MVEKIDGREIEGMKKWRWKYFTRDELACKGSNSFVINEDALDKLEKMRVIMGAPLKINSAYRSFAHNKKVGGKTNSMHVQGRAFDVAIAGHNPVKLYAAAVEAGFTGFGFYRTFLHVDTGAKRSWGSYAKQYQSNAINFSTPKALSIEKEQEKPHKIEGVALSDKQKVAVATTTGVAGAGATVLAIEPSIIIEHAPAALSFLQMVDWRVAIAVIIVVSLGGLIWWKWGRK